MSRESATPTRMVSARPLVRYVDEDQGVIEIRLRLEPAPEGVDAELEVQMFGPDGEVIHRRVPIQASEHGWMFRFEIAEPRRWWPAGMGEQALYELTMDLLVDGAAADRWESTVGLTSVRRPPGDPGAALLVNGREREIHRLISVEPNDEKRLLAASGDALLVVRDHYGPDELFDAADRAGVMLLQAIPAGPRAASVEASQIDRLAAHPSLAGWLLDPRTETFADRLQYLDPTRVVFRGTELQGS